MIQLPEYVNMVLDFEGLKKAFFALFQLTQNIGKSGLAFGKSGLAFFLILNFVFSNKNIKTKFQSI